MQIDLRIIVTMHVRENLLGFPAAVRLASGLYTGLCFGHRGHVRCLSACCWTEGETDRHTDRQRGNHIKYVRACTANYIHEQNCGG